MAENEKSSVPPCFLKPEKKKKKKKKKNQNPNIRTRKKNQGLGQPDGHKRNELVWLAKR